MENEVHPELEQVDWSNEEHRGSSILTSIPEDQELQTISSLFDIHTAIINSENPEEFIEFFKLDPNFEQLIDGEESIEGMLGKVWKAITTTVNRTVKKLTGNWTNDDEINEVFGKLLDFTKKMNEKGENPLLKGIMPYDIMVEAIETPSGLIKFVNSLDPMAAADKFKTTKEYGEDQLKKVHKAFPPKIRGEIKEKDGGVILMLAEINPDDANYKGSGFDKESNVKDLKNKFVNNDADIATMVSKYNDLGTKYNEKLAQYKKSEDRDERKKLDRELDFEKVALGYALLAYQQSFRLLSLVLSAIRYLAKKG